MNDILLAIMDVLTALVNGYDYNPGSSDLDNEQIIHVRMNLGVYRRACRLIHTLRDQ